MGVVVAEEGTVDEEGIGEGLTSPGPLQADAKTSKVLKGEVVALPLPLP